MLSLVMALALSQAELPPEARLTPPAEAPAPPSVMTRTFLATGGGALAGGASLGIALLLTAQSSSIDPAFATAGLTALLVSGVSFTIHQALGGNGEITLAFLATAAIVAGAAGIASAADPSRTYVPYLVAGIGALPGAAAAVLALELTTPQVKGRKTALTLTPTFNGVYGTF